MNLINILNEDTFAAGIAAAVFNDFYYISREFVKVSFILEFKSANPVFGLKAAVFVPGVNI